MLTLDSHKRKPNELNETSHLYLWYDRARFQLMNYSKSIS